MNILCGTLMLVCCLTAGCAGGAGQEKECAEMGYSWQALCYQETEVALQYRQAAALETLAAKE